MTILKAYPQSGVSLTKDLRFYVVTDVPTYALTHVSP